MNNVFVLRAATSLAGNMLRQSESELDTDVSAKVLPNENDALATLSSASEGPTAPCGSADHKFYVPPCGLVFYIMTFLGFLCAFALNAALSVAIVAMVNQTTISKDAMVTANLTSDESSDLQCPRDPALESGSTGEFAWDRYQQTAVLAAFYYGRQLTQVLIVLNSYW